MSDEILQTIRNIKRTAAETEATSIAAATLINSQGEDISSISRDADKIENNLNLSGRVIKGFSSLSSRFFGNWTSPQAPAAAADPKSEPATQAQKSCTAAPLRIAGEEGDAALDEVSSILSSIKNRTLELSSNLKTQNSTLNRVNGQVDLAREKISSQHSQIKKT